MVQFPDAAWYQAHMKQENWTKSAIFKPGWCVDDIVYNSWYSEMEGYLKELGCLDRSEMRTEQSQNQRNLAVNLFINAHQAYLATIPDQDWMLESLRKFANLIAANSRAIAKTKSKAQQSASTSSSPQRLRRGSGSSVGSAVARAVSTLAVDVPFGERVLSIVIRGSTDHEPVQLALQYLQNDDNETRPRDMTAKDVSLVKLESILQRVVGPGVKTSRLEVEMNDGTTKPIRFDFELGSVLTTAFRESNGSTVTMIVTPSTYQPSTPPAAQQTPPTMPLPGSNVSTPAVSFIGPILPPSEVSPFSQGSQKGLGMTDAMSLARSNASPQEKDTPEGKSTPPVKGDEEEEDVFNPSVKRRKVNVVLPSVNNSLKINRRPELRGRSRTPAPRGSSRQGRSGRKSSAPSKKDKVVVDLTSLSDRSASSTPESDAPFDTGDGFTYQQEKRDMEPGNVLGEEDDEVDVDDMAVEQTVKDRTWNIVMERSLYTHLEKSHMLDSAEDFFCFKRNSLRDAKIKRGIPGFKRTMFPHQCYEMFLLAYMVRFSGANGVLFGPMMGMCKTATSIGVCLIEWCMTRQSKDIAQSRRRGDGRHLPEDNQGPKARCPSQRLWPIQCMCVKGSITASLGPRSGANLVMAPKTLVLTWAHEFNLTIHPSQKMKLLVRHDNRNDNLPPELQADPVTGRFDWRSGACIIVTAPQSCESRVLRDFKKQLNTAKAKVPKFSENRIVLNYLFIDEFHSTGKGPTTKNMKISGMFTHRTDKLPNAAAIFVSGTPIAEGLDDLTGVRNVFERPTTWPSHETFKQYDAPKWKELVSAYRSVVKYPEQHGAEKKQNDYVKATKTFLEPTYIRHGPDTDWNGQPCIDIPPLEISDLTVRENNSYQREYDQMQEETKARYYASSEYKQQYEIWNNTPAGERKRHPQVNAEAYFRYAGKERAAASIRGLAKLYVSKELEFDEDERSDRDDQEEEEEEEDDDDEEDEEDDDRVDLTGKQIQLKGWRQNLDSSPYFRHLDMLVKSSAKIRCLKAKIDELAPGEPLIVASEVIPVYLTVLLWLRKTYGESEVLCIDASMESEERHKAAHRFQGLKDPETGCYQYGEPSRFLVGVTRIIGEGLTLTRAKKVFLMEPQVKWIAERQVYDRVHRIPQQDQTEGWRCIDANSRIDMRLKELHARKGELNAETLGLKAEKPTKGDGGR